MRRRVKKFWNRIEPLTAALNDAKEMKLKEGESVKEEIDLIEKQIEVLAKAREELIEKKFSINSEQVSISNF